MVPDTDAPDDPPERAATDDAPSGGDPGRSTPADRPDDGTYDLVYRAARDAVWDVLGTATLILFYLALAALGVSLAVGGIGPFLRGSGSVTGLAVGVAALVAGVFSVVRVYQLVTE